MSFKNDKQRKAVMAKLNTKTPNPNYAVVKKNTSNRQYIMGDADKDKTPNIDDQMPYDSKNKKQVADFSLKRDLQDIEKTAESHRKPLKKVEKRYQNQGYETISRVKGLHSTLNKLKRKHLHRVRDMGGMNIFVRDEKEAHKVGADIEKHYKVIEKDDYYKEPRESGYRAIHYVVIQDGKPVEIHIQTKEQFRKSQVTHKSYKEGKIDKIVRDDSFYKKNKNMNEPMSIDSRPTSEHMRLVR